MKVYLVIVRPSDDVIEIRKVFTSLERAIEYRDEHYPHSDPEQFYVEIGAFEVET